MNKSPFETLQPDGWGIAFGTHTNEWPLKFRENEIKGGGWEGGNRGTYGKLC